MSQKMLAAVYGVDKRTVSYHISKVFKDSELDRKSVVQKYWTTGTDGKKYLKDHYDLRVIIALGFKIVNGTEARLGEKIGEVGGKVEAVGKKVDRMQPQGEAIARPPHR